MGRIGNPSPVGCHRTLKFGSDLDGNELGVAPDPGPVMTDPVPARPEETPPAHSSVVTLPPRLLSPTDKTHLTRRPESDPELWVAVAAELAE